MIAGVTGAVVRVEVDVSDGLPSVGVVGLPDASVSEARWRVRCAITSSGATWPNKRLTIGLSPAELRKQGAGLDLPMAVGVLAASAQVPTHHLVASAFIGELGLDGRVHAVRGTLPGALAAMREGLPLVIVPSGGAAELTRIPGIRVAVADHLVEVLRLLRDPGPPPAVVAAPDTAPADAAAGPDLADVRGHAQRRLGLEVAAAGGHHLAMVGPPGVGKPIP